MTRSVYASGLVSSTLAHLSIEKLVSKFGFSKLNLYRYGVDAANDALLNAVQMFDDAAAAAAEVGRCTLCILLAPPPPRLIDCTICRPMRRLNGLCIGQ
jgi:hypothetical protein